MRRLIKREKGAVATLLAVLLGSGALLAVVALAVDFGRVYLEEQTLKNAASSGALALANACAYELDECSTQNKAEKFVKDFLDANSADGKTELTELCGDAPLDPCVIISEKTAACQDYLGSYNQVRVIATSLEKNKNFLELFFTNEASIQLAQCAQAEWALSAQPPSYMQTQFDLGFPICDYPGDQTPIVWFQFRTDPANPAIPREASCTVQIAGEPTSFVDLTNGLVGVDLPVGQCTSPVSVLLGGTLALGEKDLSQLCTNSVGAFLDTAISLEQDIPVAVLGEFNRKNKNSIDFKVAAEASIRMLGYRISGSLSGGATPPGGWASYPVGAGPNDTCSSTRPCFYGYYVSEPEFVNQQVLARLVYE